MQYIDDKTLSYPVLIEGEKSRGSGFYIRRNHRLYLITAKHVLYDDRGLLTQAIIQAHSYDNFKEKEALVLRIDLDKVKIRSKDQRDLAVVYIADIPEDDNSETFKIHFSSGIRIERKGADVFVPPQESLVGLKNTYISNDVYVMGYPVSLGKNKNKIEKNKPLLRKGIVAGINRSNKTIILDCPVYHGNSGGIVIQIYTTPEGVTKYGVIGVVTEFIPFIEELKSSSFGYINTNIENSGYSIVEPMDTIFSLIKD